MATLKELLGVGERRTAVIDDALTVLDAEVRDKGGVSGLAIKAAYATVKGIQPGFVRKVVSHLLDDFLDRLDPVYQEALASGKPPGEHLLAQRARVASALLEVTDARAESSDKPVIKKAYQRLRSSAARHVEDAAPRLAAMLERHTA